MITTSLRRSGVAGCRLPVFPLLVLAAVCLPGGLHAQTGGKAALASGCPQIAVPASPSTFIWWDGKIRREAALKFFAIECLPVYHPAAETTCENGAHCTIGSYADYVIVATADFEAPGDSAGGKRITIEALSAKGVVLGHGPINFTLGEQRYHETTRIRLSEAEIQRVVKLTIREAPGSDE
jgi:hypothetical protein